MIFSAALRPRSNALNHPSVVGDHGGAELLVSLWRKEHTLISFDKWKICRSHLSVSMTTCLTDRKTHLAKMQSIHCSQGLDPH